MQNLSEHNRDYAIFLPAISQFYASMIRKEQEPERIPAGFEKGQEGLNFLQPDGYFHYNRALYSAGHAKIDLEKSIAHEPMVWTRDRDKTLLVSDSGGFQIGKGVIKFDWERFFEKEGDRGYKGDADRVRKGILRWQEHVSEWSMVMDIPTWATMRPETGLKTFDDCLKATLHNNDFYVENRTEGMTKFLNVIQGGNWEESQRWYDAVKHYPFEGWGMGGQNMCNMEVALKRLITLRDDGLLEGRDWIHFLGTSKLDWACMLTLIQRQLRKINPNITISFDCASPFVSVANGRTYSSPILTPDKWGYVMTFTFDDRKFKNSDIPFPFQSEIGKRLTIGDICYYGPGDLNKIGKEGATSWDSFSYALLMAHNTYQHIRAVQMANNLTEIEVQNYQPHPSDWRKKSGKNGQKPISEWVPNNILYFATLVEEIFASDHPFSVIDDNIAFIQDLSVSRNRKTNAMFDELFGGELTEVDEDTFASLDDDKMEALEHTLDGDE